GALDHALFLETQFSKRLINRRRSSRAVAEQKGRKRDGHTAENHGGGGGSVEGRSGRQPNENQRSPNSKSRGSGADARAHELMTSAIHLRGHLEPHVAHQAALHF